MVMVVAVAMAAGGTSSGKKDEKDGMYKGGREELGEDGRGSKARGGRQVSVRLDVGTDDKDGQEDRKDGRRKSDESAEEGD